MTTSALDSKVNAEMDVEDSDFKPLSAEQAQQLREINPEPSPWWVIAAQVVAGLIVAGIAWSWTGRPVAGVSALYGALTVAIPAALFVRGLARGTRAGSQVVHPSVAMLRFAVWELIKLVLTVAFLAAAPWVVGGLNWLALLAGVVAAMKMYWVALVVRPRLLNRIDSLKRR
jgi:ATP synthase protein I